MSVLVLENFLEYPTVVREWALQKEFYDAKQFSEMTGKHTDWPGKRTQHVVDLDPGYADVILGRVAALANRHFGITHISIRSYFQLTTAEDGDSWVHQDNDTDLAAVLYLNPVSPPNSGTSIYKCNDVKKWESFMATGQGYETLKTINTMDNKQLYDELFQPTMNVESVFNRLIVYNGTEYHKSNNYFGDSLQTGRLTQVFFIKSEA